MFASSDAVHFIMIIHCQSIKCSIKFSLYFHLLNVVSNLVTAVPAQSIMCYFIVYYSLIELHTLIYLVYSEIFWINSVDTIFDGSETFDLIRCGNLWTFIKIFEHRLDNILYDFTKI